MPNPGPQGSHRKSLAVKHLDGEPLSRADLQYDFLYYLFSNTRTVFTDPFTTIHGAPPGTKVTFRDLYVNSLVQSARCSKVTRERLVDNPVFGDEFAKISLLSNVGRINTTMAFFPEMRTSLRTYHPVPSLQKSEGNLQDAPRIKNILKSCLLPTEQPNEQQTAADILAKSRSGHVPPTTIVNLVFVFAANASIIAQSHLSGQTEHDLLDFFCPIDISSESRAQAFLWLCYHYLEGPTENPFSDEYSLEHPNKVPKLHILSPEESLLENVDPPDEKEWGERMTRQRREFMANKDKTPDPGAEGSQGPKGKEKAKGPGRGRGGGRKKGEKKAASAQSRDLRPKPSVDDEDELMSEASLPVSSHPMAISPPQSPRQTSSQRLLSPEPLVELPALRSVSRFSSPLDGDTPVPPSSSQLLSQRSSRFPSPRLSQTELREHASPYPRPISSPPVNSTSASTHGKAVRRRKRRESKIKPQPSEPFLSEFPLAPVLPASRSQKVHVPRETRVRVSTTPVPHRSTLEQAFHVVMNGDPLEDSEDEDNADENTRADLLLRLRIISRLRGKEPTPEPEPLSFHPYFRRTRH
ncbi:hypothetical protein QCA50_001672 [Cerrena zonata]|uniref:Ino eighty subunit 1 n=1 Tax=Cerrena zonata TaxID=2478898 RepID=A0AAW0GXN0_9APHY